MKSGKSGFMALSGHGRLHKDHSNTIKWMESRVGFSFYAMQVMIALADICIASERRARKSVSSAALPRSILSSEYTLRCSHGAEGRIEDGERGFIAARGTKSMLRDEGAMIKGSFSSSVVMLCGGRRATSAREKGSAQETEEGTGGGRRLPLPPLSLR